MTLAPEAVRTMFDRIAPVYDAMNRVMTAGLDVRWRRLAAAAVVRPGDRVLDAACGTGDLALADLRAGAAARDRARLLGGDARARAPASRRRSTGSQGDLLALPFEDGAFDAATVGFGVRNVADLERGLRELRRVLRPGGRLAILEITQPRGPLRPFFDLWFDRVVPVARQGAARAATPTRTCPASVRRFPPAEELAALMCEVGLRPTSRFRLLGGSIVALHTGARA